MIGPHAASSRQAIATAALASCWLLTVLLSIGCATPSRGRSWVDDSLRHRSGHGFTISSRNTSGAGATTPRLDGDLDEDAAVAFALAHSPAYAADLARLRSARADFDEAARISNPRLSLLAPLGPINAAASLLMPVIELFQLPQRTEAAGRALESVAESLVQSGLDLVRDVRVAHVDADVATRRLAILEELQRNAADLAVIAEARAGAGDVSPADALAVRAESFVAVDQVVVARRDRTIAVAQLQVLLGREAGPDLSVVSSRPLPSGAPELGPLLRVARVGRPDVLAAELELQGAAARAGWERSRIVGLTAQVDVQWNNTQVGARVGGSVDIPIFNQNQGGVGRAEAAIERATHRVDVVRQLVTLEVVRARAQLAQSLDSLERYQRDVVPPLEGALDASTLRYELGDDSYLVVLDALNRLGAARLREVELEADVRRAHAQLERAVGARLEIALREHPVERSEP